MPAPSEHPGGAGSGREVGGSRAGGFPCADLAGSVEKEVAESVWAVLGSALGPQPGGWGLARAAGLLVRIRAPGSTDTLGLEAGAPTQRPSCVCVRGSHLHF